ncbi:hypothetical protein DEIPH_ctg031orf0094 [Deinococcus phoenicis]|uniref:Integral membrane protein TerC n=1 Tax=Deinococcus phoenicis TaxID=1476583 RepID=A0A016QPM5_9DEIO|nr:TerC family protein [Deinococcus phoenicis]EYB67946.1 hypothetical protein DEIPH_ctg031orf0094 [Deinococcus phoenicis]
MHAFLSAFSTPEAWAAVLSLTLLELILGIDNIVFITLLAGRLPQGQQAFARTLGLALAVVTRIALLASVTWLTRLTAPLLTVFGQDLSVRDLVLLAGGLFLMVKSVRELSRMARNPLGAEDPGARPVTLASVILQIPLLDIVFSLDSVVTAVGVSGNLPVMILAVVLAMLVMIAASGPISRFMDAHAPLKLLAAAFLLLIGSTLVGEAFGVEVPRAFIYFTMLFTGVTMLYTVRAARTVIRQRLEEVGAPPQSGKR